MAGAVVLRSIAVGILLLSVSKVTWRDRAICLILGGLWAWVAVAYHLIHFAVINPAAYVFAAFFLVQAALFFWWAILDRSLKPSVRFDLRGIVGIVMLTYALVVYPSLGIALGHSYPSTPTFGVPCPTTVFTIGVLALARAPRTAILLAVPLFWSLVGGSAAFLLGVWQDLGLLASGALAAALLGIDRLRSRSQSSRGILHKCVE